jgi:hypothetical protein
VALGLFT